MKEIGMIVWKNMLDNNVHKDFMMAKRQEGLTTLGNKGNAIKNLADGQIPQVLLMNRNLLEAINLKKTTLIDMDLIGDIMGFNSRIFS